MGIYFDQDNRVFHLQVKDTSYCLHITEDGYISHLYWGKRIQDADVRFLLDSKRGSFTAPRDYGSRDVDRLPQEYPFFGNGDHRTPAYEVLRQDGSSVTELRYRSHRIANGKPGLQGLPATYMEADDEGQTLDIDLIDPILHLLVTLRYSAYEQRDVITRSAIFTNEGQESLVLARALSASVDMPTADYDLLQLSGAWIRECFIERHRLVPGEHNISSRFGMSGHKHNPFLALLSPDADEDHGEVYGFHLVYSGNFIAQAEVEPMRQSVRVSLGINSFDFSWLLEPAEVFYTPEAVFVYSTKGLGGMSRTLHRLYRTRVCRGQFRDQVRPVLVNNWEATYFQFDADKLVQIAKAGSDLGVELFVLDDGWFGKRDSDNSSLGDWYPDRRKLPNGLEDVVKRVRDTGMQFGIWVEPEMLSPDSELYRAHPDWCLHVNDRSRTERRNQLTLDLSRDDVCDYIIETISGVLRMAPITYVKWDMNRPMTEVGSAGLPPNRQRETSHRYMLGLYRVLEKITSDFPHVLFESCASGGGRFDPGMLYYMPQTWTSDNTDAVSRLKIQYGTSLVYPVSSMGAHVSAVPNHQMHRMTPLVFRGHVAMAGNFGYELDLTKFSQQEEQQIAKEQIAFYKEIRSLVQQGDMYRLQSPFLSHETSFMFVSEDLMDAFIAYFKIFSDPLEPTRLLRLQGLNPDKEYILVGSNESFRGDTLMHVGLKVPEMVGEYQSAVVRLRARV